MFLTRDAKRKYLIAIILQLSLSIFDLAGIAFAGLIGVFAAASLSKTRISPVIMQLLKLFSLEDQSMGGLITIFCISALIFFLLKTLLALLVSRKIFKWLASQQSAVSNQITSKVLQSNYVWLRQQEPHELSTALILGMSAATTNTLGQFLLLISEFALLFIFLVVLVIINPIVAIVTTFYLLFVMYALKQVIGKKVADYNQALGKIQVESQISFYSIIRLFREIRVLRRSDWFERRMSRLSDSRALNFANDMWIQQIPKYALEVAMLLGACALLLVGQFTTNSGEFIPVLAIYLTAAGRIFPSLLRIQASIFSLQSRQHYATMAHRMFQALESNLAFQAKKITGGGITAVAYLQTSEVSDSREPSVIVLEDVSFIFPTAEIPTLKHLSIKISPGERVAIVGASGAGKSTLCDVLLGLLLPSTGMVEIGGITAADWINLNPGKVAYLPQDVTLMSGTLLENICLGIDLLEIDFTSVQKVIVQSQLRDVIEHLEDGIHTKVGDGGLALSGGQKQRVGLARALYQDPTILIMDEATSALDAATEFEVMSALENLSANTTIVMIAHRLSSIRNFPRIIYMEDGEIVGDGSLKTLRNELPIFSEQLKFSGI